MSVFHQATLHVSAPLAMVAGFITDPERVMAYFPDALEGGVFEEGEAIWVRAKTGTTLIERTSSPGDVDRVSVRVTSTSLKSGDLSRAALAGAPLLQFHEDWVLEPSETGTRISKRWRDLQAFGFMKLLPAGWLVRRAADQGAPTLEAAWSDLSAPEDA